MNKQELFSRHWFDSMGNPAGGVSNGKGFTISWQNGPLRVKKPFESASERGIDTGEGEDRFEKNGAFVETVIEAVIDRIEVYQETRFQCDYNEEALKHLRLAVESLQQRTKDREERGVEGTHEQ